MLATTDLLITAKDLAESAQYASTLGHLPKLVSPVLIHQRAKQMHQEIRALIDQLEGLASQETSAGAASPELATQREALVGQLYDQATELEEVWAELRTTVRHNDETAQQFVGSASDLECAHAGARVRQHQRTLAPAQSPNRSKTAGQEELLAQKPM